MKTCWIIYDKNQYKINSWFANELLKYASEVSDAKMIITERLKYGVFKGKISFFYDGEEINAPDVAVMRSIYPLLSKSLESAGTSVYNSSAVSEICNDKRMTYAFFSKIGVNILDTVFLDKRFFDCESIKGITYPVIMKSSSGHGGAEVFWINNAEELIKKVEDLPVNEFLIQRICDTVGKDVRVYVMGGKILGAVLRTSGSFKSNYSLGGSVSKYLLSEAETEIINYLIKHFPCDLDFVGIDFFPTENGPVFNEIEDVVGCRMLYGTHNINVAEDYIKYIFGKNTK